MTHPPSPILHATHLSKSYGGVAALHDVSFAILPGQVLGVIGPNGAGKSTLVKIVTGLVEPSQGSVMFAGKPMRDQFAAFRQSLGYVPEQADLYPFLTGNEYIDLVVTLRDLDRSILRRRVPAMFEAFQLSGARQQRIGAYSKGMRQRLALIAALLHNPSFLVLDEPFSGLDVANGLVLRMLIGLLAERGKAIFFSSPSLEHLEQVSTHLLVLRSGRVIASGPAGEPGSQKWESVADTSGVSRAAAHIVEAMHEGHR
ncbi:MAG: ABC transporter ATP-binding protein [Bryobacterales bacterium]|nr:ABC transporter ATP-binding protein [Bryobacterales bacterium]